MFTMYEVMVKALYDNMGLCTPVPYEGIVTGVFSGELYIEHGVVFHDLEEMPFDIWDDDIWRFRPATGREYFDGEYWCNEYEGDEY